MKYYVGVSGGDLLFNQVPLLVIDGEKLVQTNAIVRHLARTYPGLAKDASQKEKTR